jgi:chromosome segregation ATPase
MAVAVEMAVAVALALVVAVAVAVALALAVAVAAGMEAAVAELRMERSVCEAVLDTALRELEGHAPMVATLEERVHELARASRHQHSELEGAKVHITTALLELDVAVDENRTLAEQVQAIVQRLRAAQAQREQRRGAPVRAGRTGDAAQPGSARV